MNQRTFEEFISNYTPELSPLGFLLNIVLTAVLAYLLGLLYARYGNSLSNRKSFATNFELIAVTTMVIISIVKSSLALSLGLVGALSIVRFRAAIKEPQELAYIFFTIAIGLGFGADQRVITLMGFAFVAFMIIVKNYIKPLSTQTNLNFTILTEKSKANLTLDQIVTSISPYCKNLEIKRMDENKDLLEASFLVEFANFNQLNAARNALIALDESIQISFLDYKGIN